MQVSTLQTAGAAAMLLALGAGALTLPLTSATPQPPRGTSAAGPATADGRAATNAPTDATAAATSWAPTPATTQGLSTLATADGRGLRLLTGGGTRDFIAGVDLGATTPGHFPGELSVTAADYRRWFVQMGRLGIRSVRIYTIHPPAFYTELAAYNRAHPDAPLYLVQGVYLPDESYTDAGRTLYDPTVDTAFAAEIADATLAVRGALERQETPGRASGTWDADVTPWLMSWIIGIEWDPEATQRTDRDAADAPAVDGPYFRSTPDATATERWLARHLNDLATIEARNGRSMPIAFVNWPSTDPLAHPAEPHPGEDLVGIDANHIRPTLAWPGGTFASYHAYPYYPDFLRYENALQTTFTGDRADPYAGYLAALKRHHQGMPVMITETGVPSSIGSGHDGPLGRDQGGHREQRAMAIDADLLRVVHDQGLAGAFLFSWSDEWFKFTWNTVEHQMPAERRPLWHDALTNEQHFGLLATDPNPLDGARTVVEPGAGSAVRKVAMDADASFVYLDVTYPGRRADRPLTIMVDAVPGGVRKSDPADYRIVVDPVANTARALVRAKLQPARLDTWEPLPQNGKAWQLQRLVTNRSYAGIESSTLDTQDVGRLVRGTWQTGSASPNSLAIWQTHGNIIRLRLPWALLGIGDPSTRTALGEGTPPTPHVIDGLGLTFTVGTADTADTAGTSEPVTTRFTWPTWDTPSDIGYTERLKAGVDEVAEAFTELNR